MFEKIMGRSEDEILKDVFEGVPPAWMYERNPLDPFHPSREDRFMIAVLGLLFDIRAQT